MKVLISIFFCLLTSLVSSNIAEQCRIHFSHIGLNDGLSNCTVNSICQDSNGDIWFATEFGINRYDGTIIKSYKEEDGVPNNHVKTIHLDDAGRLWFCCGNFIVLFDYDTSSFTSYTIPADLGEVYDFCFGPENRLIVGCRYGMHCYNVNDNALDDDYLPDPIKTAKVAIIRKYGNEALLVRRDQEKRITRWNLIDCSLKYDFIGNIYSNQTDILEYSDSLWVGTHSDGLILKTPEGIKRFSVDNGLCSNSVRTIIKDKLSRIWVGTMKGVNVIKNGEIIATYTKENSNLSHNTIRCLFEDQPEGGIWMGYYFFGIDYYHPFRSFFSDTKGTLGDLALNDELVSCIAERDGELFVGVAGKGVYRYSDSGVSSISLPNTSSILSSSNDVKVIYPDPENGMIYIGAHSGGLYKYDPVKGKVNLLSEQIMRHTYAIEPFHKDSLIIGSLDGLYVFDKINETAKEIDKTIRVRTLMTDVDGYIWAGGETGLTKYSSKDLKSVELPGGVSQIKFINILFKSSSHDIYIITDKALYKYDIGTDAIVKFDSELTFADKTVTSIVEDRNGVLWLSTLNGISSLNPETNKIRNWLSSDGIPCPQFSNNSALVLPEGEIIFGSHKGVVSFNPSDVITNPYCAKVRFEVQDDNEGQITYKNGVYKLKRNQNKLIIRLISPNYASGEHTSFEYSLDGEKDLVSSGKLILSHLKVGGHILEVRALNSSSIYGEKNSINIHVPTPLWAFGLPLFCIFLGLFIVIIVHQRKQLLSVEEETDEYSKLSAAEREFLEKADCIIKANLNKTEFSIADFAKEMYVSKSTLQHKLKEITGESALERVRKFRFEEACRLLKDKKLSIAQISEETGFSSPSYFSTSFKEYMGCIPSDYLKK